MAFEVHVFGAESPENNHTHAQSPVAADGTLLNRIIHDSAHVVLTDVQCIPGEDRYPAVETQFADSSAAIGLRPAGPGRDFEFIVSQMPLCLASLVMPPESRCEIFLNSELVREAGGFRDVESPVRELITRLSLRDQHTVTLLNRTPPESPLKSINTLPPLSADLPATAPDWPPSSHHWLAEYLNSPDVHRVLSQITSDPESTALHAGLWQINDWLDESHACAQAIEGSGEGNGDYWHAIMHRREPDASNAGYWFRRVGQHSCFTSLPEIATVALQECLSSTAQSWVSRLGLPDTWDALTFIDFCRATRSDPDLAQAARRIQWAEMLLLLAHTAQA